MLKKRKRDYTIQSVSNAFDLLEQFHGDNSEFGITDLSRRLKLTKNNVFRLLTTLASRNYIEQDKAAESYRLGLKTMELGQVVARQMIRRNNPREIMEVMVKECNETLTLSILKDFHTVNLDTVECDHPLRVVPRIGVRAPAYCTAAGKVQIAYMAKDTLGRYLSSCQFQRYTPHTITDPKQLTKQLQQIARQGYALDLEEFELGVKSVSAPIRDYTSRIIGAVTFSGPSMRFDEEFMNGKVLTFITKGAANISAKLGYLSALPG